MGTGNFVDRSQIATAKKVRPAHVTTIMDALEGNQVGRLNGVPTPGQDLGTPTVPFGTVNAERLRIGDDFIDVSQLTSEPNRIISGKSSQLSSMPKFFEITGGDLAFKILGEDVSLNLSINGSGETIDQDLSISNVTPGPSSNHTCLVNEGDTRDQFRMGSIDFAYGAGELVGFLNVDNMGSTLRSRIGQTVALSHTAAGVTEIILAHVFSETRLQNLRRGYFFNSSDNGIPPIRLTDNATLNLLSTGWVFIDGDALETPEISYVNPTYSEISPPNPSTGQYWFHNSVGRWKRYDGSQWVIVNRIPIGIIVASDTAVIGYRCFDFSKNFDNKNTTEWLRYSDTRYGSVGGGFVNVYGKEIYISPGSIFDMARDLPTGLTEVDDQRYFGYIDEDGRSRIDIHRPHYRSDLKGFYHPFETWRCVVELNNVGGNLSDRSNYFPWQRYSPQGTTPERFSFRVNSSGAAESYDPVLAPSATRTQTGRYTVTLPQDFFSIFPSPLAVPFENTNFGLSAYITSFSTTTVTYRIRGTNDSSRNAGCLLQLSFSRTQLSQVRLDNSLKG